MANNASWSALFSTSLFVFLTTAVLLPISILAVTWISTTARFVFAPATATPVPGKSTLSAPPTLPYSIPWLGSSLSFLDQRPGHFWDSFRKRLDSHHDIASVVLGGMSTAILLSPVSIQSLYKAKHVSREKFNKDVMVKALSLSEVDYAKFTRTDEDRDQATKKHSRLTAQEEIYHEHMLQPAAVNVLTGKFIEVLQDELSRKDGVVADWNTVRLAEWIRTRMFIASTTAFMGSKILETCSNMPQDFWVFDANVLRLLFGFPKLLAKDGHVSRERLVDGCEEWHRAASEQYNPTTGDQEDWEPLFGSRFTRARQKLYERAGLSMRGRASLDLGFIFGLSSNAIPCTTWMLFHILMSSASTNLLPRVLDEIRTAVSPDGAISVPVIISLPLLQSIYTECLRLYSDNLITRTIESSLVLPSSHAGSSYTLKQGGIAMAPTYLVHRDDRLWHAFNADHPPASEFYAERFLKEDEEGKTVYSTTGTLGQYFPYGGGAHICPGRVFAKQEILGAVAVFLSEFEFEVDTGLKVPRMGDHFTGQGVVPMDQDVSVRIRPRRGGL